MAEERDINQELSATLKTALDSMLTNKYGHCIAPPPLVTPFNIRHLDAILGGGVTSSAPVVLSSTPETGKSTMAFQFSSIFQRTHKNSVVIYLDVEGSSNVENSVYFENRMQTFNIDNSRFSYCPNVMNLSEVFSSIDEMVKMKYSFEEKIKKAKSERDFSKFEMRVLIIWDSIASTPSSKEVASEDVNSTIGYKARELTYLINKYKQSLAMNKINFLVIDQVRSNMKIQSPFAQQDEKSIGDHSNYKSATAVASFQHAVKQWIYLSKSQILHPTEGLGIDGYVINVSLDKNKLAPSGAVIPLVFDKKYGIDALFSEYLFLSTRTKTEIRNSKNKKAVSNSEYPLSVEVQGRSKIIRLVDPNTGEILRESDKFTERTLKEKYEKDQEFKKVFDLAMKLSVEERILKNKREEIVEEED